MPERLAGATSGTFKAAAVQVLQDAGEPLHYRAITDQAVARGLLASTGQTPDQTMASQLYTDFRSRGDASPFVQVRRGVFGLRKRDEPIPAAPRGARPETAPVARPALPSRIVPFVTDPVERLCAELEAAERDSANPLRFEDALTRAFTLLGFDAQHLGGSGETDILLVAYLGPDGYRAVIDAKSSRAGRISDAAINWLALDTHRKHQQAAHAAVVAPAFGGGNLTKWADEYQVALLTTATITEALRLHRQTPFTLHDLRSLLSTAGQAPIVLENLSRQHQATLKQWHLLTEILRRVDDYHHAWPEGMTIHAQNVYFMLVGTRRPEEAPSVVEVQDALTFLASRAVSVLRPIEGSDGYRLAMAYPTALRRLEALVGTVAHQQEPERNDQPDSAPPSTSPAPVPVRRRTRGRAEERQPLEEIGKSSRDEAAVQGAAVAAKEAALERLRAVGHHAEPIADASGCVRLGGAVCYLRYSRLLNKGGKPNHWYGLYRSVLERAAEHGPVFLVLVLRSADQLLLVPIEAIRDMLDASPLGRRQQWQLEVLGQPGTDSLQPYMPRKLFRDASGWYEAFSLLAAPPPARKRP
jgi:hypothetical protein